MLVDHFGRQILSNSFVWPCGADSPYFHLLSQACLLDPEEVRCCLQASRGTTSPQAMVVLKVVRLRGWRMGRAAAEDEGVSTPSSIVQG